MRPNMKEADAELLQLAQATERVAEIIGDPSIAARLRKIADEVRALARHRGNLWGTRCQPA